MNKITITALRITQLLLILVGITVLIITVFYVIDTPKRNAFECFNNMRQFDSAKYSYAMAYNLCEGTVLTDSQVQEIGNYIKNGWKKNKCPSGGKYSIGTIGQYPKCSIHGSLGELIKKQTK